MTNNVSTVGNDALMRTDEIASWNIAYMYNGKRKGFQKVDEYEDKVTHLKHLDYLSMLEVHEQWESCETLVDDVEDWLDSIEGILPMMSETFGSLVDDFESAEVEEDHQEDKEKMIKLFKAAQDTMEVIAEDEDLSIKMYSMMEKMNDKKKDKKNMWGKKGDRGYDDDEEDDEEDDDEMDWDDGWDMGMDWDDMDKDMMGAMRKGGNSQNGQNGVEEIGNGPRPRGNNGQNGNSPSRGNRQRGNRPGRQRGNGNRGGGRGRGLSNLPAWLVEKQKQEERMGHGTNGDGDPGKT